MRKLRSVEDMVGVIENIYEETFGGKERRRYKVSRANFRMLSGRKRLEGAFIQQVIGDALEEGFIVTDLGDYFAIVKESVMLNYRPVPKSTIQKFALGEQLRSSQTDEEED